MHRPKNNQTPFPRGWPQQISQALSLPFVHVRGLSLGEVSSLLGWGWPGVREGVERQAAATSEPSMITGHSLPGPQKYPENEVGQALLLLSPLTELRVAKWLAQSHTAADK